MGTSVDQQKNEKYLCYNYTVEYFTAVKVNYSYSSLIMDESQINVFFKKSQKDTYSIIPFT